MSKLIVLGNINEYTFLNSIAAAQAKSKDIFNGETITDIFVLHTQESYDKLSGLETTEDWMDKLKNLNIGLKNFTNKRLDNTISDYLKYIEGIIKDNTIDNLLVDLSNGDVSKKILLGMIVYALNISNVFYIDTTTLFFRNNEERNSFFREEFIKNYYVQMQYNKEIDKLAYLNLTEVIRYREIVNELSALYKGIDENSSEDEKFRDSLLNVIKLKLDNDNKDKSDNTYRIFSTAIASGLEEVINEILVHIGKNDEDFKNLEDKIKVLQKELKSRNSKTFDYLFFEKFNEFMLYLRNSSTGKRKNISGNEKMKAELSLQMSLVCLEYYSTVVLKEFDNGKECDYGDTVIEELNFEGNDIRYFGLDGDNTGQALESLFMSDESEENIQQFSNKIKKARENINNYLKDKKCEVIFAEGDDMLFRGKLTRSDLEQIKKIYKEITGTLTCSIAYGNTFKELLFSMKLAKMEKGFYMWCQNK